MSYHPVDSHHQQRPTSDVSHLISAQPIFPERSSWHNLQQSFKAVVALDNRGQKYYQTNIYL
jgi:hypothetical protein